MRRKCVLKNFILVFLLCFMLCISNVTTLPLTLRADAVIEGGYTNVLDDLNKNENFDIENYPSVSNNADLQVIQIAESVDRQLFVYVYLPCAEVYSKIKASSINISFKTTLNEALNVHNYELTLLNSSGVFHKYLVNGFTVSTDIMRIYDVISIFRPFNNLIDATIDSQKLTHLSFEVAKTFTFSKNEFGETIVSEGGIEVINVTASYLSAIRYFDGTNVLFTSEYTDSHFLAFSCDKDMDKLLEVTMQWSERDYRAYNVALAPEVIILPIGTVFDEKSTPYRKTISHEDLFSTERYGIFGSVYSGNRIQTVSDFLESEKDMLNDECINGVKDMDYVLRFTETPVTSSHVFINCRYGTIVEEVTLLSFKFLLDEKIYELGVVDNMRSGEVIPDSIFVTNSNFASWFKTILAVIMLIILIVVLGPVLPIVFKFIATILTWAIKILVWIISAPFKFISWLCNLHKKE